MRLVRARKRGGSPGILHAGGNWNNALNAGPGYRNANNSPTNSNRNNCTHVELRPYHLGGPEQRTDPSPDVVGAKYTTGPQRGVSTRRAAERSPLSAGLRGSA